MQIDIESGFQDLLTVHEASKALRICTGKVYSLVKSGRLRKMALSGKILIPRAEIAYHIAGDRAVAE